MSMLLDYSNATNDTDSSGYMDVLKSCISIFCVLSIVGSLLVIVAYLAFKETRTTARQLLMNLSIADLITALANLTGLLTNFGRFSDISGNDSASVFCVVQAFIGQFGADSSILWTIVIALYMLFAIVLRQQNIADKLLPVFYICSWGIPAAILIWFAVAGYLGFEPNTTPGWCSIKSEPSYAVVIGYTVFVYIAFLILPVISVTISCYLKIMARHKIGDFDPHVKSISKSADLKLALIPLIFVLLRVWGVVVDIFTTNVTLKEKFEQSVAGQIMIVLKGIGDSSQGFANSILFVCLTRAIRERYLTILKRIFCCCSKNNRSIHMNSVISGKEVTDINADAHCSNQYGSLSQDASQSLISSGSQLTYEIHQD